ncbi:hypothetical protein SAMN04515665_1168 [Blastococcus sp. DSM 46786]|uniref:hypothetical protein n=1 Tax=Blastococcus sp. DSM 46786 TaxID=1798227 RepID=UPI0008CD7967|nr:hypothetical protein [Blastococcus sp. DSM 46786]SEL63675.1 hypothetical protein SAMN04515665_1168 [Blastococcus sp. DSM 46786]
MTWVLVLVAAWTMLAVLLALGIGRAVRTADRRHAADTAAVPDFVPAEWTAAPPVARQ